MTASFYVATWVCLAFSLPAPCMSLFLFLITWPSAPFRLSRTLASLFRLESSIGSCFFLPDQALSEQGFQCLSLWLPCMQKGFQFGFEICSFICNSQFICLEIFSSLMYFYLSFSRRSLIGSFVVRIANINWFKLVFCCNHFFISTFSFIYNFNASFTYCISSMIFFTERSKS